MAARSPHRKPLLGRHQRLIGRGRQQIGSRCYRTGRTWSLTHPSASRSRHSGDRRPPKETEHDPFPHRPPVLRLAAATLSCATPALAQISDAVPSVTVKYSDLNIGSRPGAQMLLKRIEAAATTVCGGAPDIRQLNQLASL